MKVQQVFDSTETQIIDRQGRWVPARPINHRYRTIATRLREAWHVFSGRADALYWDSTWRTRQARRRP